MTTIHTNAPAKALAKRLGFRYEGCLRDAITIKDVPSNMALFGLTRRDWDEYKLGEEIIEPVPIGKQELVHG
jgi:RimJ/RimL family protein N-acetyltransferase